MQPDYYTTTEVARELGITPRRVRRIAVTWGKTPSRWGFYAWTPEELERLRNRPKQ